MIRKDYIQRYLDELAKMLVKMNHFKQNNEPEKANNQLDEFGLNFLKINLNELILLPKKEIITHLIAHHQFEFIHFIILEDLLFHKYLLDPTNLNLKNCTLEVLNYLIKNDKDYSIERVNRLNQLCQQK